MLEIGRLRLTAEDRREVLSRWESGTKGLSTEFTDAQLKKVLWGVQEWLTKSSIDPKGYTIRAVLIELNTALTADWLKKD